MKKRNRYFQDNRPAWQRDPTNYEQFRPAEDDDRDWEWTGFSWRPVYDDEPEPYKVTYYEV